MTVFAAILAILALLVAFAFALLGFDTLRVQRQQRAQLRGLETGLQATREDHAKLITALVDAVNIQAPQLDDLRERLDYFEQLHVPLRKLRQGLDERRARERRIAQARAGAAETLRPGAGDATPDVADGAADPAGGR